MYRLEKLCHVIIDAKFSEDEISIEKCVSFRYGLCCVSSNGLSTKYIKQRFFHQQNEHELKTEYIEIHYYEVSHSLSDIVDVQWVVTTK